MNYNGPIEFEWNELKSDLCFRERGFDFAYSARAFFDPRCIVRRDTRHDYGEDRFQMMGKIEGRVFVIVYTPRLYAIRILSARKANQREIRCYENHTNED
ncbi:BrnT family toxin [Pusillimonas noertemannii]|uniref:BrnT family toxin n=1 Tax=Pusillimonas noertemannii TaxID=305977 RepID=UPI001FAEBA8E|nr:BrnT family toxin [Pusillimonas noertemannii]